MIENAYNLENYFFVREQKKRQTKTKQNRKEKGEKIAFSICTSLPVNFIDKILFRYGWLSFLKNSKLFWFFSPINALFIFVIYLFFIFFIVMIQKLSSAVLWLLI